MIWTRFLCGLTLILLLSGKGIGPGKPKIVWDKAHKLRWGDFQGGPDITSDGEAAAVTGINLNTFSWTADSVKIGVTATFNRKQSWTKSKENFTILAHEQGHFDIVEIFARKLRKDLKALLVPEAVFAAKIPGMRSRIDLQKEAYQEAYDKETDHNKDQVYQDKWYRKIAHDLLALNAYSDTLVVIRFIH
jgi:hypothetical protein